MTYASPHITMDEWRSGSKTDIDVFEDQLRTWLFEQARAVAANEHGGPAILALLTPYFESITSYLRGQSSRSAESAFLRAGLEIVFPAATPEARETYISEVRHGFAHEGVFRRVLLHRRAPALPAFGIASGELALDPWWVLEQAEAHFDQYVGNLRSGNPELLAGFNDFMKIRKSR